VQSDYVSWLRQLAADPAWRKGKAARNSTCRMSEHWWQFELLYRLRSALTRVLLVVRCGQHSFHGYDTASTFASNLHVDSVAARA
jgi:hypothetical protein